MGTWVAQSVKRPTLGFASGHDLTVSLSPTGSALTAQSLLEILSPTLSAPTPLLSLSLSLKIKQKNNLNFLNKKKNLKKRDPRELKGKSKGKTGGRRNRKVAEEGVSKEPACNSQGSPCNSPCSH